MMRLESGGGLRLALPTNVRPLLACHLCAPTRCSDEEGWAALAKATKDWLKQVQKVEAQSQARVRRTHQERIDAGLMIQFCQASPGKGPHRRLGLIQWKWHALAACLKAGELTLIVLGTSSHRSPMPSARL